MWVRQQVLVSTNNAEVVAIQWCSPPLVAPASMNGVGTTQLHHDGVQFDHTCWASFSKFSICDLRAYIFIVICKTYPKHRFSMVISLHTFPFNESRRVTGALAN